MQVNPDSRCIICCGYGYSKLLAIDIEELRNRWNEKVICSFPAIPSLSESPGKATPAERGIRPLSLDIPIRMLEHWPS